MDRLPQCIPEQCGGRRSPPFPAGGGHLPAQDRQVVARSPKRFPRPSQGMSPGRVGWRRRPEESREQWQVPARWRRGDASTEGGVLDSSFEEPCLDLLTGEEEGVGVRRARINFFVPRPVTL